jgi:hypothetical protein
MIYNLKKRKVRYTLEDSLALKAAHALATIAPTREPIENPPSKTGSKNPFNV